MTQTLLEQLRAAVVRHTIVVWLDRDGHYTALVDELVASDEAPARAGAPVLAYRGSFLELVQELAPMTGAVDPPPLILHVPGANEDAIKQTPLLELYEAGFRFRKALDTLIREAAAGRVTSAEVDEFLAGAEGELEIEAADAWMARRVEAVGDTTAALLRGTDVGRLIHDLLDKTTPLHAEIGGGQLEAVRHFISTETGLPEGWPSASEWARAIEVDGPAKERAAKRRLAALAATWVLSVEYVHDLRRPPVAELLKPAEGLARPLVEACRKAATKLRAADRSEYVRLADEVEDRIAEERTAGEADELGRIDTFRFEEDRLLVAALDTLAAGEWSAADDWARQRLAGESVWIDVDPGRRQAWQLAAAAAELGAAIEGCSLAFGDARSLADAARRYAELGAKIDRLHRGFEQDVHRLLYERLPHRERLDAAVAAARACWRGWAEARAREWSELCEREGALPGSELQQRAIFERVVEPELREGECTALFLVDALRFEMAGELLEHIGSPAATSLRLEPFLAELPTITEVGMNVLAPSAQRGKLRPIFDAKQRRLKGFDAGGFQVIKPEQRKTLLGRRAGGLECKCFELAELLGLAADTSSLRRRVSKSRLVVVHSQEIDKAGEAGAGLSAFPKQLRAIFRAWEALRAAGVRRFVITSDHGFLLRRSGDDQVITHGQGHDPMARYVLYPEPVSDGDRLGISLRSLDYEGAEGAVVLPRGLAVYQSGKDRNFVHGGNSPQERVIPVLTIRHKQAVGGEDQHYRVKIEAQRVGSSTHELKAVVLRADNQTTLALEAEPIELELRALGAEGVVAEPIECEGAGLDAGMVSAAVGEPFTLRFRLSGTREQRVRVELYSASAKHRVDPGASSKRFLALAPSGPEPEPRPPTPKGSPPDAEGEDDDWLDEYAGPVRKVMAHIAKHGEVSEADLQALLGSPRKLRKFARNFEDHAARAPFLIEIEVGSTGRTYRKVSDK